MPYSNLSPYYPHISAEGFVIVRCHHCHQDVSTIGHKLQPHGDPYCEGSNRMYYNMFGTKE